MHYVDIKLKLFDDDDDISEETEEDIANVKSSGLYLEVILMNRKLELQ